jgi:RNA polymerase sigma factor (sigma-70 family)
MDNDELIELQRIIKEGGPEADDAARRFCDKIKDSTKRMLSSISYKYSKEYLEWGINEAFLAFRDNWNPEKGMSFKGYLWKYVKERVRTAIAKDRGKESSIDAPLDRDDEEESNTGKDTIEDNELSPEETYEVSELSQILTATFNRMDSKIQIIMIEYYSHNSTFREIGEKLGIAHTTVMRNLNESGIKPLKNEIKDFFEDQGLKYNEEVVLKALRNFFTERDINNENRTQNN